MIGRVVTRDGATMPALGQGTWRMGERLRTRREEADALRLGFDLGMTLVDTAEMYADGGAEEVVADAISGRREKVFVVTKVLPDNATRAGTVEAAERSLRRLRTSWIDLYLLHWPGRHPLEGTLEAFERLREAGKVRHYGLSNFDLHEMEAAERMPGGRGIVANQVLYNLGRRGIERRLLPWCSERGIAVMAYSPFEQRRLRQRPALRAVAARHGVSPYQIALAWTMRLGGVVAIAKSSDPRHVRENAAAAEVAFTEQDLEELDRDYPRPSREIALETL